MRKLVVAAGAVVLTVAVATSAAPPVADSGPSVVTHVGTVVQDYLRQLVAAEGTSSFDSIGATVTVTPSHPHPRGRHRELRGRPTAHSGPSVVVAAGTNAQLAGSASDPDGDALEIRWLRSVVSGASLANCTFTGPTDFQPATSAGLAPTMTCSQPGQYLLQLVVGDGQLSDDDTGARVTVTPARDRSPAQCLAVRLRSGAYVVRLQDPESGVVGFRVKPFVNVVLTPPGKSFPMPVAQTDIGVSRPAPWSREGAFIRHINGAGVEGTCAIAAAADGTLRVHPWRDPLQVASR